MAKTTPPVPGRGETAAAASTQPRPDAAQPPQLNLPARPKPQPTPAVADMVPGEIGLHATTVLSQDRIERYRRSRFNALLGITPSRLVQYLSDWDAGYLRYFALTMEQILRRDTIYKIVYPKRMADAARQSWQIQILPGHDKDPEALAQKDVLEHFYQNLRVKSATEGNQVGGVGLAVRQMVKFGVGMKYCVHEILWRQTPAGLTATLNHVPPWFFEARTGKLRFLMEDFAWDGVDITTHDPTGDSSKMEIGSWMVSVGEGLMEAGSILYVYGNYALRDWADYSEQRGSPLVVGHTKAPDGSERYQAMAEMLAQFGPRNPILMGPKDEEDVDLLSTAAQGAFAPQLLWEEMKKCKIALWRGGDLGTVSSGQGSEGAGASLQGGETTNLQEDDCQWASENFQMQLDPLVIRITRGPNVPVLAYFSLGGAKKSNTALEVQVDQFLLGAKFPLSVSSVAERYNRPVPAPEETLLVAPAPPSPFGGGGGFGGGAPGPEGGPEGGGPKFDEEGNPIKPGEGDGESDGGAGESEKLGRLQRPPFGEDAEKKPNPFANQELANVQRDVRPLLAQALHRVGKAQAAGLAPVAARLRALVNETDDAKLWEGLRSLRRDLPGLLRSLNKKPAAAGAFAEVIGSALAGGAAAGTQRANEELANKDGFVTMNDHVVFVGKDKDETDGGDRDIESGGAPKRVSEKDQEEIRSLAEKAGKAQSETMDYFFSEKDKYEASGKEWVEHPLFKGKDPTHTALDKASKQSRGKLDARVAELSKRYPYLKDGLYFGFTPSGQEAVDKMTRFHREAVIDHVRQGIAKEAESVTKRIREADKTPDPTSLKAGQHVWDSKTQKVFRVSRLTHGGKRAMATDETGVESRLAVGQSAAVGGLASRGHYYHKITESDAKEYRRLMGEFKKRVEAQGASFKPIANSLANETPNDLERQQVAEALGLSPDDPQLEAKVAAFVADMESTDETETGPEDETGAQRAPAPAAETAAPGEGDAAEPPDGGLEGDAGGAGAVADGTDPGAVAPAPTAADAPPNQKPPPAPKGPPPELLDFEQFQASDWAKPQASGLTMANPGQMGAQHKTYYTEAVKARRPVLRRVADYYGVQVPYGYAAQGDRYVWTLPAPKFKTAVPQDQSGAAQTVTQGTAPDAGEPHKLEEDGSIPSPATTEPTEAERQEAADALGMDVNDPGLEDAVRAALAEMEAANEGKPCGESNIAADKTCRMGEPTKEQDEFLKLLLGGEPKEQPKAAPPEAERSKELGARIEEIQQKAEALSERQYKEHRGKLQPLDEYEKERSIGQINEIKRAKKLTGMAMRRDNLKAWVVASKQNALAQVDKQFFKTATLDDLEINGPFAESKRVRAYAALYDSMPNSLANAVDPSPDGESDNLGQALNKSVGDTVKPEPSPNALADARTIKGKATGAGNTPELMTPEEFAKSIYARTSALGVGANQPWHLRAAHRSYVEDAMAKRQPLLAETVRSFNATGFKVLDGYRDDGNGVLVWEPQPSNAPPKTWAQ